MRRARDAPRWYLPRVTEAEELRASRARLAAAAGADRRRIERALHDGVQQDLIAVSVRLQLLRELIGADLPAVLELLDELQHDTREALTRVRSLAGDVYPALLESRGLPDAIREAARSSGASVHLEASDLRRHPAAIESALYFFCRSALERAADGGTLTINLGEQGDVLRLEIAGLDDAELPPARDLLEAAGGVVLLERTPDDGPRIVVTVAV
jgi:signal transduction histidine kinase